MTDKLANLEHIASTNLQSEEEKQFEINTESTKEENDSLSSRSWRFNLFADGSTSPKSEKIQSNLISWEVGHLFGCMPNLISKFPWNMDLFVFPPSKPNKFEGHSQFISNLADKRSMLTV
jgi:hypothetical protein